MQSLYQFCRERDDYSYGDIIENLNDKFKLQVVDESGKDITDNKINDSGLSLNDDGSFKGNVSKLGDYEIYLKAFCGDEKIQVIRGFNFDNCIFLSIKKKTLSAPTELKWDTSTNDKKATWKKVNNASAYSLQLYKDGNKVGNSIYVENNADSLSYDFTDLIAQSGNGEYIFKVMAMGNDKYEKSEEADSATQESGKLAGESVNISTITMNGNNKVIAGKSYSAKFSAITDGVTEENVTWSWKAEENSNDITKKMTLNASTGAISGTPEKGTYKFTVTASFGEDKSYSKEFSIVVLDKLSTPTNVQWWSDAMYEGYSDMDAGWKSVQNAKWYEVQFYKDGVKIGDVIKVEPQNTEYGESLCTAKYEEVGQIINNAKEGKFTFTVKAIGDGINYLDSDEVDSKNTEKNGIYDPQEDISGGSTSGGSTAGGSTTGGSSTGGSTSGSGSYPSDPNPTVAPTTTPSEAPSATPTVSPSTTPSAKPGATPTVAPSTEPSSKPDVEPTVEPSTKPTAKPTEKPTAKPSKAPAKGEEIKTNDKNNDFVVTNKTNSKNKTGEVAIPGLKDGKKSSTVTIPKTVKCNGYTYKVTSIANNAYAGEKSIKKVTIGNNVKTIGIGAFKNCTNLSKVTVDKGVKKIGKDAFSGCKKVNTITIGKDVTFIGKDAFKGDKNLKTLTIKLTKLTDKNVANDLFAGVKKCTIYVPKSQLKKYKKIFAKTAKKGVLTFKTIK